ncbi:TetR/AcrR family transcriptional regulator, partial [Pseudomonas aeruginosa]
MQSATELFRQHGVYEVSLAKIMGEIGMTPGGFYKYFDSKEALA